jgi:hypothetical protein
MMHLRRTWITLAALLLTLTLVGAGNSVAGSKPNAPHSGAMHLSAQVIRITPDSASYSAGSAVAHRPGYDSGLWAIVYSCSYSGWARVKVNWSCRLYNIYGTRIGDHSGSFSNGGQTYGPFYTFISSQYTCVKAYAAYNDGSDSDSSQSCA